ncbi:hypothetical protein BGX31_008147 [Mortierella sp. GBA43]|nr:hypothetical protein BGX31_008147 [Mortierella sp. GBA43]
MADTRLKLMALERLEQGISWLSKTGTDERIVSSLVTLLQADANLGSFSIGPELTDGMQHRDESSQQTLEASIAQLITNPPQPSVDPPSALEAGTDSHADQVQQSENDGSTLGHETNDTEHREPREDDDEQDSVLDSFFAECHEVMAKNIEP